MVSLPATLKALVLKSGDFSRNLLNLPRLALSVVRCTKLLLLATLTLLALKCGCLWQYFHTPPRLTGFDFISCPIVDSELVIKSVFIESYHSFCGSLLTQMVKAALLALFRHAFRSWSSFRTKAFALQIGHCLSMAY